MSETLAEVEMTFVDWHKKYKPVHNPNSGGDPGFWGCMFETFGEDIEYMKENYKDNRHYWTLVDGEGIELYLFSGIHLVNRLGYFVTEEPWEESVSVYDV
jgi:hypothetical protein